MRKLLPELEKFDKIDCAMNLIVLNGTEGATRPILRRPQPFFSLLNNFEAPFQMAYADLDDPWLQVIFQIIIRYLFLGKEPVQRHKIPKLIPAKGLKTGTPDKYGWTTHKEEGADILKSRSSPLPQKTPGLSFPFHGTGMGTTEIKYCRWRRKRKLCLSSESAGKIHLPGHVRQRNSRISTNSQAGVVSFVFI